MVETELGLPQIPALRGWSCWTTSSFSSSDGHSILLLLPCSESSNIRTRGMGPLLETAAVATLFRRRSRWRILAPGKGQLRSENSNL